MDTMTIPTSDLSTPPPPPPAPKPNRKRWVIAGALGLLALMAASGSSSSKAEPAVETSSTTLTAPPAAAPVAARVTTTTTEPAFNWTQWAARSMPAFQEVIDASTAGANTSSPSRMLSACTEVIAAVRSARAVMLPTGDATLTGYLGNYFDGLEEGSVLCVDGITDMDPGTLRQGALKVGEATTWMTKATARLKVVGAL